LFQLNHLERVQIRFKGSPKKLVVASSRLSLPENTKDDALPPTFARVFAIYQFTVASFSFCIRFLCFQISDPVMTNVAVALIIIAFAATYDAHIYRIPPVLHFVMRSCMFYSWLRWSGKLYNLTISLYTYAYADLGRQNV
jgi:glucan phosphoethanolaminetransferase (alkaline phosphatase superfamily)